MNASRVQVAAIATARPYHAVLISAVCTGMLVLLANRATPDLPAVHSRSRHRAIPYAPRARQKAGPGTGGNLKLLPASTSRAIARRLRPDALSTPRNGISRNPQRFSTDMAEDTARRALCVAVDIKDWSGRPVPEQIRAQEALVTTVREACGAARLPRDFTQATGDGILIVAPSGIDETQVIPDLIQNLQLALRHENRMLSERARIRLRMAFTEGMIIPGPAGITGRAIIECFRLLDSLPVRHALDEYQHANMAVIVSDGLYQDVISQGFPGLQPSRFQSADCSIPAKRFRTQAWLYIPN